ncbi:response regulator transcription factor [Paraburkholderia kururiensis]|uniref:response regulator transcription factor n=1 Tax=Paraburkholderia kururiensis TaxID=984307 RepID=UPI00037A0221|nr:response regulator transcription factor [Paraburkholderia kururiensis]
MNILILDENVKNASALEIFLTEYNFRVSCAQKPKDALEIASVASVDLIILDWLSVSFISEMTIESIRAERKWRVPAIGLVNQRSEIDALLQAADVVDEYILKPFSGVQLAARIRMRNRTPEHSDTASGLVQIGTYLLDTRRRRISVRGQEIELTMKEYDVIALLFRNAGKIVSRQMLSVAVWGRPLDVDSRTVDTHIYRLRKKLQLTPANGVTFTSVYTHGYRLDDANEGVANIGTGQIPAPVLPVLPPANALET